MLVVFGVVLLLPLASLLWRAEAIRQWAGSRILAEMSAALHADVAFSSIEVQPGLPPRLVLEGLAVTRDGRELARVGRLVAEPRLRPLLHGQLDLSTLVLERARVDVLAGDLVVDDPGLGDAGTPSVRIEDLRVRDSSLSFRDAATGLAIDVPDLSARSPGFLEGGQLLVHLEGASARLEAGGVTLSPVDFSAQLRRDSGGLRIDDFRASAPGVEALVRATIALPDPDNPLAPSQPSVDARVEVEAVTGTLVALGLLPASVPDGRLAWTGRVLGRPRGWSAWGRLSSDRLELRQDLHPTPILRDLAADVTFSGGALDVTALHARLGRGSIAGEMRATRGNEGWLLSGRASVEELALREVPLSRSLRERLPDLEGSLGFDLEGALPLADPSQARLTWTLGISRAARESEGLAVAGEGRGLVRDGRAVIERLDLAIAGAELQVTDGVVGLDGSLAIDLALDAPRLAITLDGLRPQLAALASVPRDLDGAIAANATLGGSLDAPTLAATVAGTELVLGSWPLGGLDGALSWSATHGLAAQARVEGEALTLIASDIAGGGGEPLSGRWEIERAEAGLIADVAGLPSMAGTLTGSGSFEGRLVAGAIEGADLVVAGQAIDRLSVEGRATERGIDLSRVELARGDARALGSGRLPWSGDDGDARLEWTAWPLELPFGGATLTTRLSGSATISGSVRAPRLEGEIPLRGDDVHWRGFDLAGLEGTVEQDDLGTHLTLRDPASGALVRAFIGSGEDQVVRALGTLSHLEIPLPAGESERDLELEADQIDLVVEGSLADLPGLRITAEAQSFALRGENFEAHGLAPLHLEGPASQVALESSKIAIFGQPFDVSGSVSIVDPISWQVDLEGDVPLSALEAKLEGARFGGRAAVTLHAAGDPSHASVSGKAEIRGGYVNHPAVRQSVRDLDADIVLGDGLIVLERLDAVVGGGSVTGTGQARLEGWRPTDYDVALRGENVALRFGDHFRGTGDFRIDAESRGDDVMLTGDVQVFRARLTTPVGLGGGSSRLAQMRPPGPLDSVLLDLRVRAPDQFIIDNDAILAEFEADLDVVGTAARPIALGSLDLVREGKLFFKGTEFDLSDASFQLTRQYPGDPEMDAHATTRLGFHEIEMGLAGRPSDPDISLSSIPELPEESLAAMLATKGRLSTSSSEFGASLPAPFARSRGTDPALSAKGVDPVRLEPVFVEGSVLPSARLTLGQQLTPKLFAGYSLSLRGDQEGTMELTYRVKPRLELRFAYEEGGTNVGEVRWTRSWRSAKSKQVAVQSRVSEEELYAPRVRSVSIPGLHGSEITQEVAAAALEYPPGSASTKSQRLRAAGRLRDFLVTAGHPLARVSCIDVGDVEGDQVDVSCVADVGPKVSLILEGVDESSEKIVREAVIQAWGELAFRDELVTSAAFAAQEALLARGHARATARASADDRGDEVDVRVALEPGEIIRVGSVELIGAAAIPPKKLRRELVAARRQGWKHPKLTPDLAAADRDTLLAVYQAAGHVEATVEPAIVTYPADAPLAALEFRIVEGEERRLVGVLITGNEVIADDEVEKLLPLGVGDVARPDVLDRFARDVSQRLDELGYPDGVLSWRLRPAADGRILECVIVEGPKVSVGDVRVEGLSRTKESIVRRELRLETGADFRRKDLAEARKRLAELGLFQSIIVRGEPRADDPSVRDVLVRILEKPQLDMSVGVGIEDSDPRFSFSIGQRNVGGTGASLGLQLHASGEDRLLRLLAGLQRVGGTRNDVLFVAGFERDDHPGFTSDITFVGGQMTREIAPNLTLLPRFRWEDVELPRLDVSPTEARFSEGIISGPGVALLWDTRDDPIWPNRGSVASLDLSLSADTFGADFSFTKAFAQYSFARTLREDSLILAGSIRAGAGWSFDESDRLPLSERFFAGGVGSVRGWELDHLGPKDAITGEPVGGDAVLVLNSEIRKRLSRRAWFIGFVDAGNVFDTPSGFGSPTLEVTFGPGVGLSTPIGPLRFYYGHKLEDPDDEPSGEFHFTFGSTF